VSERISRLQNIWNLPVRRQPLEVFVGAVLAMRPSVGVYEMMTSRLLLDE
jgi:hypothetical protein